MKDSNILNVYTLGRFEVVRDGISLIMNSAGSKKIWELFKFMLTHKDRSFTPESLMDHLWVSEEYSDPRSTLRKQMHRLRKTLGEDGIDGDEFDTMEPGSKSLDPGKIKTISFKVKISGSAAAREERYETNASSQAIFNVADDNPYYEKSNQKDENGNVIVPLTNKGWLTIEQLDDPVVYTNY